MINLSLFCALACLFLSLVLCKIQIPLLKKVGAGQNILHYVKEHQKKGGTPSMGGLGFVLATLVCALIFIPRDKSLFASLAIGGGYLAVGFLDDCLKKLRHDNLGLRPYQKTLFQLAVAVIASVYCYTSGASVLKIPFTALSWEIGWGIIPLGILIFVATVNSVNLTDGLDGLAGSVSAVFFLALGVLIVLQGGNSSLYLLCFCLVGALLGYLPYNVERASVFMGDTGSLALGGFASAVALFSGNALALPVLGITFVFSSISVIIQVIYYKRTGKRVFLMSPAHHHFQQKGYSEGKIAFAYALITAVAGVALLFPFA